MDDKKTPTTSIHTLENDLAAAISDKNYGKNIIKIVTDPAKNSFVKKSNNNSGYDGKNNIDIKKIAIILFSILIIVSLIAFYLLYRSNPVATETKEQTETKDNPATTTKPKIITNNNILNPEIIKSSDFSNKNKNEFVSEIENIKNIVIENKISPYNNIGIQTNVSLSVFMEKIRYSGELGLIRSLSDDNYYFGIYSMPDNKFETYILMKVNDFDLAFKSMLGWEKYMASDLRGVFIGDNRDIDTVNFIDKIIKNHSVRKYVKNSDNITLIYGFINNKYILITSGESSFIDIKDRLLKENISR